MTAFSQQNQDTPRQHRTSFVSLIAIVATTLALVACASAATSVPPTNTSPPTATPPPTPTPAPEVDIGQQLMDAVQEPGMITVVNTTFARESGDKDQPETSRAWLDFPDQRVRIETWLDGEPATVSVVEDGTLVEYSREQDQIEEHPVRFFGISLEEARDSLPQHLSNPALLGLAPLATALVHTQGQFRSAGEGQWQGRPATLWEADFPQGTEGYDHTFTTLYLGPESFRPLGQEVRTTSEDPALPERTATVNYQVDFVSPADLSWRVFQPGRGFHPQGTGPTPLPTAGPPPPPLPAVPASDLPPPADNSSLLRVMEKLPASFSEKGLWFADYAGAWGAAGLPPRPSNLEDYLALSDEETQAYQQAQRGLMGGPTQLGAATQHAKGWEQLFGVSGLAVSLAVGTGHSAGDPFATAYLEADFDAEDARQRLLDLGYREESVSGGTYYAIRGDREQDLQSPIRQQAGVLAQMNRVFLADGVLAASPDTDPIVDVVAVASGDAPVLSDDPVSSRLAASLSQPLSATLLTRSAVLEPDGWPELGYDTYERPEGWSDIHQWESLAAGFTRVDGAPWWAISLFYPDPEAAEADAAEIMKRMNSYRTAITPRFIPSMSEPMREIAAEHPYPIHDSCTSLTPVYTSDEAGSVLTVWCQARPSGASFMSWEGLMDFRDLGFLLP